MRQRSLTLDVKTAVAVGDPKIVRDLQEKYVHLSGTFSATVSIEVSLDGINYFAVATGLTAAGMTSIPHPASHMRINTTVYASGTPVAVVGGFDDNG
jgi:hypothetical protein